MTEIEQLKAERDALQEDYAAQYKRTLELVDERDSARRERDELAARVIDLKHERNVLQKICAERADEIGALSAHVEWLHDLLNTAPAGTGVCCCGDSMENHGDPMSSGHTPVDEWDHHVRLILEQAPQTSLARRDAQKQAEALSALADSIRERTVAAKHGLPQDHYNGVIDACCLIDRRAKALRQQAEG